MAFLAAALPIAATLFSTAASMGQANYQAKVAKRNAAIAGQNANLAAQQAQIEQQRQDREYAALEGTQFATQGASGLDVLGASQMAVRAKTRKIRGEAATDIRRQGEAETASYFNQAAGYKGEANAYKSQMITTGISGVLKAGSQAMDSGLLGKSLIGKPKSRKVSFQ